MSKQVLLVVPSAIVARGLEQVLSGTGEFEVACILGHLSGNSPAQLKDMVFDVIIIDPSIFEYASRSNGKSVTASFSDAPVVAMECTPLDDNIRKQYDGVLSLTAPPAGIIEKLREAIASRSETQKNEGEELSAREKEILVCVAQGLLNKEIADRLCLSIHTVITHRKNITRKTGIKTVAGLTVYALMNGLMEM